MPKIAKVGLIKKVLDVASKNISDERLCESTINLLENLATDDGIIEEVARNNGLSAVIKMMKQNANNKKIVENGTRTLGLLSINEENAGQIIDNGIVEFLIDTAKKHPDWRKCAFYSINLIDGLSEMEQVLPVLKKTGGLQAVISIMSGKNYDTNRFEKKDSPEESDVAHINEDEDKKQVEVLNPKQEIELKESGLAVLEKLVSPEEIKTYKTSVIII